jgi:hypothetical protein
MGVAEANFSQPQLFPSLKIAILENLMKSDTAPYPAAYDVLYEQLVHIPNPFHEIVHAKITGSLNYMNRLRRSINLTGDLDPIPLPADKSLAFVYLTSTLHGLGSLFQFFAPNSAVIYSRPIDAFSSRIPLFVSRNFVEQTASHVLSQLYESGIYTRWQELYSVHDLDLHFRYLLFLQDLEMSGFPESGIGMHQVKHTQVRTKLFHEYLETGRSSYKEGPRPLSMDMFRVVFISFAISMGIGVIVLAVEMVTAYVSNRRKISKSKITFLP